MSIGIKGSLGHGIKNESVQCSPGQNNTDNNLKNL